MLGDANAPYNPLHFFGSRFVVRSWPRACSLDIHDDADA